MQENKLQIAKSILELTTKGDLKQSFDLVIGLMKELRNDIRGELFTSNAQNKKDLMELSSYIQKTETKLTRLISNSDGKIVKSSKELSSNLVKEVSKLDKKISEIDNSLSVNLGKKINLFDYRIKEIESKLDNNEIKEIDENVDFLLQKVKELEAKLEKFDNYESPTRNPLFGFRLVRHDETLTGDGTMSNPLSVSGGGGSGAIMLTTTNTIDDSNTTFGFTNPDGDATLPTMIVVNGLVYRQNGGAITWSVSGTDIVLSSPVGTGGSIFGIFGGIIIEMSGTIDNSNTTFTSLMQPIYVIMNGAGYLPTSFITWSYTSGTTVLSSAVGTGGSVFGLSGISLVVDTNGIISSFN